MAKKSSIENNLKKQRTVASNKARRNALKAIVMKQSLPIEERFQATLKLAQLPRNGAENRVINRCEITGRPRAYYRKMRMSRIALRELGNKGLIPGLVKSSW
jgi:small subunit ribosomal protein S14